MLEYKAIKLYYDMGGRYLCPKFPVGWEHYVPMCEINNQVLFHADSVVMFCHVFDPDTFAQLNRNNMIIVFPIFYRMRVDICSLTFRVIEKERWKEIIK